MATFDNMSQPAMAAWERLSQKYGNLKVNSAYRSPEHNAEVGGAKKSQHIHGNAFDVDVSGLPQEERLALIEDARGAGFQGVGVYNNALHFDVGPSRAWGADYTSASLPDWAKKVVGAPVGQHAATSGQETTPAPGRPQTAPQQPQNALSAQFRPIDTRQDPRAFQNALYAPIPTLNYSMFKV